MPPDTVSRGVRITPPKSLGGPAQRARLKAADDVRTARDAIRALLFEASEEKRGGRDDTAQQFSDDAAYQSEWAAILEAGLSVRAQAQKPSGPAR